METFSALLAICAGNSPVPGEFPTQRPVTRSFDVYFDLRPNERLRKPSLRWWFETLSPPLWRHRNDSSPSLWWPWATWWSGTTKCKAICRNRDGWAPVSYMSCIGHMIGTLRFSHCERESIVLLNGAIHCAMEYSCQNIPGKFIEKTNSLLQFSIFLKSREECLERHD